MNQKDYKAIAEIIKVHNDDKDIQRAIVIDLADYFEKSIKERYEICERLRIMPTRVDNDKFNKKQFLKECGVK